MRSALFSKIILLCFYLWLSLVSSSAELQRFQHPVKADGSLSFLDVGDWGRKGLYNQSEVAFQMGLVGEKLDIDFGISTGDNFYEDGLTGVDDRAFQQSFTNIYTSPSLQKQWYNVLGNHDYRGNVEAQLSPILREKDSRWLCFRSFILQAGFVDFFLVDTTPFIDTYFTHPEDDTYDWKGIYPRQEYLSTLLTDVDTALKVSDATWKIVVGRHTILSTGYHGVRVTTELLNQLLPILRENKVDMYTNGHDHCLEHIIDSESGIQFLTSGGGSKAWRGDLSWWNPEEMKLFHDGQEFMSMQMTQGHACFIYYNVFGNVLHKWNITKDLVCAV